MTTMQPDNDILIVAVTALLTFVGATFAQFLGNRLESRRNLDERRLMAIVDLRQKVEISGGRWRGWAKVVIEGGEFEDPKVRWELASTAIHDAWYSTVIFELYFPEFEKEMELVRKGLGWERDIADSQVKSRIFNPKEFESGQTKLISDVTRKARNSLKL